MGLAANAFVTVAELKGYLNLVGAGQEAQLEACIGIASTLIETYLRRQIVTRGSLTEFHSPKLPVQEDLFLGELPIIDVASVNEDASRTYGAGSQLATTDYIVSKSKGKLVRAVNGGGAGVWWPGFRTVKVVYTAGYQKTDGTPIGANAIPADLKLICFELSSLIYQEADRKRWGISTVSDAMGNITRYMGYLTPDICARMSEYARREVAYGTTWERDE